MNIPATFEIRTSLRGNYWKYQENDLSELNLLEEAFNIDITIAKVLAKRISDSKDYSNFFNPTLKNNLPNPYVLKDMKSAVELLIKHLEKDYKVGILSDYDVDGATSAALIFRYFKSIGISLEVYIPDRIKEGYGISKKAIDFFKSKNIELLITLDCGTNEKNEINYAKEKNIRVVVIDHHEVKENTKADAIINPKQKNDKSRLNYLATVGITFLFLVAINRKLRQKSYFIEKAEPDLREFLDLVALGTVCDLVPLYKVNRLLVKKGIKRFNKKTNLGLKVLLEKLEIKNNIQTQDLGFYVGPCINAAGRIGKSNQGFNLLTSESQNDASQIADELIIKNKERKAIEELAYKQAEKILMDRHKNSSYKFNHIAVFNSNWHPGILGIIASRLVEKYGVPTFVISTTSSVSRGSVRSIKGIKVNHLLDYLKKENIIFSGGGHELAGGFEMIESKMDNLQKYLKNILLDYKEFYVRNLHIDLILEIGQIDIEIVTNINKIGPFGVGNPEPRVAIKNLNIAFFKEVGKKKEHITFILEDIYGSKIRAIMFNSNNLIDKNTFKTNKKFHVLGKVKVNEWKKKKYVQLIIDDIMLL